MEREDAAYLINANVLRLGWTLTLLAILLNGLSFYLVATASHNYYLIGLGLGISALGAAYFHDFGVLVGFKLAYIKFYERVCIGATALSHVLWFFLSAN